MMITATSAPGSFTMSDVIHHQIMSEYYVPLCIYCFLLIKYYILLKQSIKNYLCRSFPNMYVFWFNFPFFTRLC